MKRMFRNLKSLFIIQEGADQSQSSEEDTPDDGTTEDLGGLMTNEEAADILGELNTLDDFDAKLAAALEGELIDEHGIVDQEIVGELLDEVEKNNLDGFDYFEYKQSLKALDKMPMDEATKYRSAFATAATMGITLDELLETANFYLGILDAADKKFQSNSEQEKKKNIGDKEEKVNQLEKTIQKKEDKIKKLQAEIAKHKNRIAELQREVKIDRVQIEKTHNNFMASFNFLRAQFADDIAKMKKYLK